jgi:hypothetical protein
MNRKNLAGDIRKLPPVQGPPQTPRAICRFFTFFGVLVISTSFRVYSHASNYAEIDPLQRSKMGVFHSWRAPPQNTRLH